MNILVVDDHSHNRQLLEFILEERGDRAFYAENGADALQVLEDQLDAVELILMDVNMPVLDGIAATREIRRRYPERLLPILFVTALDDPQTLSQCLEAGGDDFVAKPISEQVLMAKIRAHQRTLDINRQLQASNEALRGYQRQQEREHAIVDLIFANALDRTERGCANVAFHVSPMSMFNGDLLLVTIAPNGHLYALVGDFTGHGLAAAVGCMPAADIFFAMAAKQASVGAIAAEINRRISFLLPDSMFCCALIAELGHLGDTLEVWSGGMHDGYLVSDAGELCATIKAQHMPLGVLDEREFSDATQLFHPPLGSRLYAYTDGIIETQTPLGEMFGEQRLRAQLLQPLAAGQDSRINPLIAACHHFRGAEQQQDDIALLELHCQPVDISETTLVPSASQAEQLAARTAIDLPWQTRFHLAPSQLRSADPVNQLLRMLSAVRHIGGHLDLLYTVLSELFNNALEHGVLGLDSSLKRSVDGFQHYYERRASALAALTEGHIEITLSVSARCGGERVVVISLCDSGAGFDAGQLAQESEDASYGRGLALVRSLCESLKFDDDGRRVTARYVIREET